MWRARSILVLLGLSWSGFAQAPSVSANELARSVLNNGLKAENADGKNIPAAISSKSRQISIYVKLRKCCRARLRRK